MIHHYTSIASLALILNSGKLRFTRLDQFDDVLEAQDYASYKFGQVCFASSWCRHDDEDIPQWAMYGAQMAGVRISLRNDPFIWHVLDGRRGGERHGVTIDNIRAPYSFDDLFGNGYVLAPEINMHQTFGQPVTYVSDIKDVYQSLVHRDPNGKLIIKDHIATLGRFKNENWSFQREYRFVLVASGGPKKESGSDYFEGFKSYFENTPAESRLAETRFIDLDLHPTAIQEIQITLGPLTSAADRIIVQSLIENFCPNATLHTSKLSGTIRPR